MTTSVTIIWFRRDLRLADNPALHEAATLGKVLPIYIHDTTCPKEFLAGTVSNIWLHYSLHDLASSLDDHLEVYQGSPEKIIKRLVRQYDVTKVVWNSLYDPWMRQQEQAVRAMLDTVGVAYEGYDGCYLWKPGEILKKDRSYYKVFGAYQKCVHAIVPRDLVSQPKKLHFVRDSDNKTTIKDLDLISDTQWEAKIKAAWKIEEHAAQQHLSNFIKIKLNGYKKHRDYPAQQNVSNLSAYLHFGQISPQQVWHAVMGAKSSIPSPDRASFISEITWREFASYVLYHFEHLHKKNFQKKFNGFAWKQNKKLFEAWKAGKTGYPLVDAGMRQLAQTGSVHNRVRMVVASFLVKNLLIDWRHGMEWFWECLVDADLASNAFNWQWVAGSGTDAAPYFRIFNPTTQAKKFDPQGAYIAKFVPELAELPVKYRFEPWKALNPVKEYPEPIVALDVSRKMALDAYKKSK